jgi:hypothetical protein
MITVEEIETRRLLRIKWAGAIGLEPSALVLLSDEEFSAYINGYVEANTLPELTTGVNNLTTVVNNYGGDQ